MRLKTVEETRALRLAAVQFNIILINERHAVRCVALDLQMLPVAPDAQRLNVSQPRPRACAPQRSARGTTTSRPRPRPRQRGPRSGAARRANYARGCHFAQGLRSSLRMNPWRGARSWLLCRMVQAAVVRHLRTPEEELPSWKHRCPCRLGATISGRDYVDETHTRGLRIIGANGFPLLLSLLPAQRQVFTITIVLVY